MMMISPHVELALWVVGFFYFLGMAVITNVMDQEGLIRNKGVSPIMVFIWLPVLWPLWAMLALLKIWNQNDR
jgi:hypothetical protein